jgi:hypothetical protein
MLLFTACNSGDQIVNKQTSDTYNLILDDSTIIKLSFFDKTNRDKLKILNLINIQNQDTVSSFYRFSKNGLVKTLEFTKSVNDTSLSYRYKDDGTLWYKTGIRNNNIHGYGKEFESNIVRESISKDGKVFINKDSLGSFTTILPSKSEISKGKGDTVIFRVSNDIEAYKRLNFHPDSLRILFVSTERDFHWYGYYDLLHGQDITDTVDMYPFKKGEKVQVLVHYFGDSIVDQKEGWNAVNFKIDEIEF